ncbi:4'-phosphopantetheinyl transferase family protein [Frondihabitans australicus]|uniref:4'-phosphopantetheinyl transferase n=1 Tax=Frondihabitans australicus TaxID=386892 RepID=A0A495ID86_9MICO|nr:4'-phosphopantetheinyl transferase superfamily protein [Frondihabitans australicus]RKR72966.1 4'-phosphopantetheinyl transferase [Frondihabitans australicus]
MGLADITVHVVDLDALAPDSVGTDTYAAASAAASTLDAAERERAGRLRSPVDRRRYIEAHRVLRRLLGDAVGVAPGDVRILRAACLACGGPHGKPQADGVEFSLSRSGAFAAIALGPVPCGVDIEERGAQEPAALAPLRDGVLAPGESGDDLLATWVRKEALLKATGEGLTRPMAEVSVAEAVRAGILRDLDLPVALAGRLVGAVAVTAPASWFTGAPPATGKVRALSSRPEGAS